MRFVFGILFVLATLLDLFVGSAITYELRKEKGGTVIGCTMVALTVINIFCIYQAYMRLF